jgi:hypothetical protein
MPSHSFRKPHFVSLKWGSTFSSSSFKDNKRQQISDGLSSIKVNESLHHNYLNSIEWWYDACKSCTIRYTFRAARNCIIARSFVLPCLNSTIVLQLTLQLLTQANQYTSIQNVTKNPSPRRPWKGQPSLDAQARRSILERHISNSQPRPEIHHPRSWQEWAWQSGCAS